MPATLRPVISLLMSTFLLLSAAGLLTSLLPLRGAASGFSETMLGGLTSAYYVGFLIGTFAMPPIVRRIGHIRAFAFCAAIAASVMLLHGLGALPWAWLVLRLLAGIVLVGLYTIIESWLNSQAPSESRGTVFGTYMIVNLGGLAVGQQLLRIPGDPFVLFTVTAILTCLAMLPVLLTHQHQPEQQSVSYLPIRRLLGLAPTAVIGALLTGLAMGAFYGLSPVYAGMIGFDTNTISTYISLGIAGGIVLQLPLGRWSDRVDRRVTMCAVGAMAAVLGVAMWAVGHHAIAATIVFCLYGGMALSIYPMVVAHLVDHLSQSELLAASSSVLLIYGAGSALGPVAAGALMGHFGPAALPIWFAVSNLLLAAYAGFRYLTFRREVVTDHNFRPMQRTTPTALELVPEINPDEDQDTPADDQRQTA